MLEDKNSKRLLYKDVYIHVTKHEINGHTVFRIVFEDKRKPLIITDAMAGSKAFWTSIPQGRPQEAHEIGQILEQLK